MATIKDVAKHADVSIATVSRIMNNRGPISEKTRQKVYASMEALNFRPNEMARALQKQKSNIIGVIVPSIQYPFFSILIEAIEEVASQKGYKLMLCRSGEDEAREIEMVALLEGNKVDGIILCSRVGDATIYEGKKVPIVSIDRRIEGLTTVTTDNYYGGSLAAKELFTCGCQHPLLFGSKLPEYLEMNERNRGFLEECRRLGMDPLYYPVSQDMVTDGTIAQSLIASLDQYQEADGLFITSDVLAAEILTSPLTKAAGLADRLPLVAYDGLEVSRYLDITTIEQPVYEVGACAAEQVIQGIQGKMMHAYSMMPVQLIERATTKKFK